MQRNIRTPHRQPKTFIEHDPEALGYTSRQVHTLFGEVHIVGPKRRGSKTAVLFLHGFGSNWSIWTPMVRAIQNQNLLVKHDLLMVDLPSFGKSENQLGHLMASAIGDELVKVVRDLGYKEIRVTGHSMGGFLALDMAATKSMVISAHVIAGSYFTLLRVIHRPLAFIRRSPAIVAFYSLQKFLSQHPHTTKVLNRAAKSRGSLYEIGGKAFDYAYQNGLNYDAEEAWSSITVPVYATFGEQDKLVTLEDMEELLQVLPTARVKVIRRTGHSLLVKQPEEVAHALFSGVV